MISNLKIRIKELEEQLQEREVTYQLTHLGFCTMVLDLFVFSPFSLLQCGWNFFKLCKELTLPRFFPTFDMDQLGKILRHHWKRRLNISKLAASLKLIDLKRATTQLRKAAKIYRRLYRVGSKFVTPDRTNFCKISRLWGAISYVTFQQITFKIGNFTNLKTLFPAESTDFPWLAHEKSWKKNRGKVDSSVLLGCPWLFEYKSLSRTSLQIA